jgi:hypothetical protein
MTKMSDKSSLNGLIDAALEISERRRETIGQLRDALEHGREREALELAQQLCGINYEQKSNRVNTSVN